MAVNIDLQLDQLSVSKALLWHLLSEYQRIKIMRGYSITQKALSSNIISKCLKTKSLFKIVIYEHCIVILKEELFH